MQVITISLADRLLDLHGRHRGLVVALGESLARLPTEYRDQLNLLAANKPGVRRLFRGLALYVEKFSAANWSLAWGILLAANLERVVDGRGSSLRVRPDSHDLATARRLGLLSDQEARKARRLLGKLGGPFEPAQTL